MIDPRFLTNYTRNIDELEEFLLFAIAVAGKNAMSTAASLDRWLQAVRTCSVKNGRHIPRITQLSPHASPFGIVRAYDNFLDRLGADLREAGMGCYSQRAVSFNAIARSGLNLQTCSAGDLEGIKGIGPKTSRLFVLHSRPSANHIPLDVHMLRWLQKKGHSVPPTTPKSGNEYTRIENLALAEAAKCNLSPADFDLWVWRQGSGNV